MSLIRFAALATVVAFCGLPTPSLAGGSPATGPNLTGHVSALDPNLLYQGWRARPLLGQMARAKGDGRTIGTVRDLVVDKDGRAAALVIEGGGPADMPDALYRVPWANVDLTPGQDGVRIDLASGSEKPQYGLFPGSEGVATLPREFRLNEILGDYARLQSGYGYGVVTDAVFTRDGRMSAVLVTRDVSAGGGTTAFAFRGVSGPWDPGMSYYGLPFVTGGQAREAGLRIDPKRFSNAAF
jgi:hypothetical protein